MLTLGMTAIVDNPGRHSSPRLTVASVALRQ